MSGGVGGEVGNCLLSINPRVGGSRLYEARWGGLVSEMASGVKIHAKSNMQSGDQEREQSKETY